MLYIDCTVNHSWSISCNPTINEPRMSASILPGGGMKFSTRIPAASPMQCWQAQEDLCEWWRWGLQGWRHGWSGWHGQH